MSISRTKESKQKNNNSLEQLMNEGGASTAAASSSSSSWNRLNTNTNSFPPLPPHTTDRFEDSDEDMFTVPDVEGSASQSVHSEGTNPNSNMNQSNVNDPQLQTGKRRRGRNPADKEYRRLKRLGFGNLRDTSNCTSFFIISATVSSSEQQEKLQQAILESSSVHEAFIQVFGKEHPGHVRGMGLGVTPTQILGNNSHSTTGSYSSDANEKMSQMQNEIDALKAQVAEVDSLKAQAAEVDALKEQVAELPLLKEQLAYVMQILKQNQPDNLETHGLRRSSESSNIGQHEAAPSRRISR